MRDRSRECTFATPKALARIAAILALLTPRKRSTAADIAVAVGLSHGNAAEYLRYLRGVNKKLPHERMVRIAGWCQLPGSTQLAPLYALGVSRDAPRPRMAKGQREPLTFKLNSTLAKLDRIRKALNALGPLTAVELENISDRNLALFMSSRRIRDALRYLKGEHPLAPAPREVYVSGWKKQGDSNGRRSPQYALGNLPDVPEPKRTKAQQRAHDRARRKKELKDPAKREALRADNRRRRLIREGKVDQLMPEPMALLHGLRKPFDMEYYAAERPWPPVMLQLLVRNVMLEPRHVPRRQTQ